MHADADMHRTWRKRICMDIFQGKLSRSPASRKKESCLRAAMHEVGKILGRRARMSTTCMQDGTGKRAIAKMFAFCVALQTAPYSYCLRGTTEKDIQLPR
jgi:hypothetical protein